MKYRIYIKGEPVSPEPNTCYPTQEAAESQFPRIDEREWTRTPYSDDYHWAGNALFGKLEVRAEQE